MKVLENFCILSCHRAKIAGTYRDVALRTDTHPHEPQSSPLHYLSVSCTNDDSHLCWCEFYNLQKGHSALTPFIRPFSRKFLGIKQV